MAQSIKLGSNTFLDSSGVVVDSSGTTLASWITSHSGKSIIGNLNGNSSTTVSYEYAAMIFMFRNGNLTAVLCDQWDGFASLSTYANYTVTVSSKVATLSNGGSSYCDYIVFYK